MLDQMYLLMISDEILLEMQLLIYHGHEGIVRLVWFRTNTPTDLCRIMNLFLHTVYLS